MEVLVIMCRNNILVAVVEKPYSMTEAGAALAWAKASGYSEFPKDCSYATAPLTTFGSVAIKLMPSDEVAELSCHTS